MTGMERVKAPPASPKLRGNSGFSVSKCFRSLEIRFVYFDKTAAGHQRCLLGEWLKFNVSREPERWLFICC
jgi:hypothetical protein